MNVPDLDQKERGCKAALDIALRKGLDSSDSQGVEELFFIDMIDAKPDILGDLMAVRTLKDQETANIKRWKECDGIQRVMIIRSLQN